MKSPEPCPFEKIFPSELNRNEEYFMTHAYNEAIEAWNKDEVPIGAVIEHRGMIIASAHNQSRSTNDPTAHAEMLAITQAANALGDWRLNECTLYVTKEPCPMCSGALVIARIGKVYYGLPDEKMGCVGGATDLGALPRSNHHFESVGGVLEALNHQILKAFFETKRAINATKKAAKRTNDSSESSEHA
ncbi:MAG: nucleoside deaminase [Coraliomargarita sp.]